MHKTHLLSDLPFNLNSIKIVISDLDFTLADFSFSAAQKAVSEEFGDELAKKMNEYFSLLLEGGRYGNDTSWQDLQKHNALLERIAKTQNVEISDVKKWCRASVAIISCEDLGITWDFEMIKKIRNAYWRGVESGAHIYEDAAVFLNNLEKLNIPLFIMTSSDSVFRISDSGISYDPDFSISYKLKRIQKLQISGLKDVFVGDPIDKPDERFFDMIEKQITQMGIDLNNALFMGDSYATDLIVPQERGHRTLLVNRNL